MLKYLYVYICLYVLYHINFNFLLFKVIIITNINNIISMDLVELSNILFDPNGPSKIGIELDVHDENGSTGSTAHTDLYEFLLNLLIIGIEKLDIIPNSENYEFIEVKLQHFFKRINITISLEPTCIDYMDDPDIYCTIYIDESTEKIKIVPNPKPVTHNTLSDVIGLYIIPKVVDNEKGKKRAFDSDIIGIYIKFNYMF
jgi:hypothetical protein